MVCLSLSRLTEKRSAYSLIELLIVIAIISILAALLFPVLSASREMALKSDCSSNMKQLGLAIAQYNQDYDEYFPYREIVGGLTWKVAITPYLKSTGIFSCPSNPASNTTTDDGLPVSYVPNCVDNNPSLSENGIFGENITPPMPAAILSQVTSPTTTITILETVWTNTDFIVTNGYFVGNNGPKSSDVDLYAGHIGLSNYLFADGHVRAMPPNATLSFTEGGLGQVDAWRRDASNLSGGPLTNAQTILANSSNYYH